MPRAGKGRKFPEANWQVCLSYSRQLKILISPIQLTTSLLLPLPVLGSIITGIKSLVSSDQHFGHPAYEAYRAAFTPAVSGCKNCIVVSGHEKSLQYYKRNNVQYFVAGSGEEITHARK